MGLENARATCLACGTEVLVVEESAGAVARCSRCGQGIRLERGACPSMGTGQMTALGLSAAGIVLLLGFQSKLPEIRGMLADLGASLPQATRVFFQLRLPLCSAVLVAAMAGVGVLFSRRGSRPAAVLLAAAPVFALAALGLCVVLAYLPIFELAGAIK